VEEQHKKSNLTRRLQAHEVQPEEKVWKHIEARVYKKPSRRPIEMFRTGVAATWILAILGIVAIIFIVTTIDFKQPIQVITPKGDDSIQQPVKPVDQPHKQNSDSTNQG
jgi:hypothetical protein